MLLPSYVFQGYLNIDVRMLFGIVIFTAILALNKRLALHKSELKIVFFILLSGIIGSIFSGRPSQLLMALTLSSSIIIISSQWLNMTSHKSLSNLNFIVYCLILLAISGFIFAFIGGVSESTITLQGGREVYLYLTTYTGSVNGNLIRPAAIFDEPGAFAMFITLSVALNEALRGKTRTSYIMIFGGLITGSFILFLIAIIFIIYKLNLRNSIIIISALILCFFVIENTPLSLATDAFFVHRINELNFNSGFNLGDNRTIQVIDFFEMVNSDMTLRGAEDRMIGPDQSSNPFSIYYGYGIFIWMPYFVLELWLFYATFFYKRHLRFSAFIVFLTLLQRPYLYNLYWQLMIVFILITIYKLQKQKIIQSDTQNL